MVDKPSVVLYYVCMDKHPCPNCGAMISQSYDFCARNVYGRIVYDPCKQEFERFWRRPQAAKPAVVPPTKREWRVRLARA